MSRRVTLLIGHRAHVVAAQLGEIKLGGYRGDDLTTATGTDPQTILADGTNTPVNALVNQTNPNTNTTGAVAEFELANPTIALQGSGTADAPFILISVDTTGLTHINVAYNLRDIDGSADNAVQPVALQFRVGASGNFTNVPAAFVADATSGPNLATLVTPGMPRKRVFNSVRKAICCAGCG